MNNAINSDRLVFGIALQYYDDEMPDLSFVPPQQLRTKVYDIETRPGVTKIRYELTRDLFQNEDYFLMVDSHVLADFGWDIAFINDLKEMAKLSGHDNVIRNGRSTRQERYDYNTKVFQLQSVYDDTLFCENFEQLSDTETFNALGYGITKPSGYSIDLALDCCNFFTYGRFVNDVGFDSISQFGKEELYLSWKAFVSGWDSYITEHAMIYQYPTEYFNYVWNGNKDSRTYSNPKNLDQRDTLIKQEHAMINNAGIFSVKNNVREPRDFFKIQATNPDFFDTVLKQIGNYENKILISSFPRSGKTLLKSWMSQQLDIDTVYSHDRSALGIEKVITIIREPVECIASWVAMEMHYEDLNPTRAKQDASFYIEQGIQQYILFYNYILKNRMFIFDYNDVVNHTGWVIGMISSLFSINKLTDDYTNDVSSNTKERHLVSSSTVPYKQDAINILKAKDLSQCLSLYNKTFDLALKYSS